MEKTINPVGSMITVPWLPPITTVVNGETIITTEHVIMYWVGDMMTHLDYGFCNGTN